MSAISVARVLAVSASLGLILTARSEVIIYDGFDYAPGRSLEGSGYNGFSWGTNVWLKHFAFSDWLTFSNSLSHSSLPTTGGHVAETNDTLGANYERKFATHVLGDGESVWFSFLAKVTQGTTWSLFLTFAGLNESKVGVQGDYYDYKIHVRIGVGYTGNVDFIDLGQNTTRLIVGRYRYSASDVEQLDLWVDPDIASEPEPGGSSSSNHIVHTRQHDSQPDRFDSVLLEDRSIGSLAFDELRIGTSWADVVSRALDRVSIDRIAANGDGIALQLNRLTPGATTTVERATQLVVPQLWEDVGTFVPWVRSTNWTEIPPMGAGHFYRVRTR